MGNEQNEEAALSSLHLKIQSFQRWVERWETAMVYRLKRIMDLACRVGLVQELSFAGEHKGVKFQVNLGSEQNKGQVLLLFGGGVNKSATSFSRSIDFSPETFKLLREGVHLQLDNEEKRIVTIAGKCSLLIDDVRADVAQEELELQKSGHWDLMPCLDCKDIRRDHAAGKCLIVRDEFEWDQASGRSVRKEKKCPCTGFRGAL